MSKTKGQHGGRRIAGEGKHIGRPSEMIGGKSITFYVDEATLKVLLEIATKPSQAIRLLASHYKKTHP
jgi:hypothetical protein